MAKQDTKQKKKPAESAKQKSRFKWPIIVGIPILILTAFYLIRNKPDACSIVARKISAPFRAAMAGLTSKIPFCLAEILSAGAILGAILYIISAVVVLIRTRFRFGEFFRRFGVLLTVVLWLVSLYCLFFGVEYLTPGFARENGLVTGGVTVEQLYDVTKLFAENASRLAAEVDRDEYGTFIGDDNLLFADSIYVFDGVAERFPTLDGKLYRPKRMYCSKLFSMMGFTGMYFPFTGECCINTDFPASGRPFTVAHELAHSRGVIGEDEANFVGIAACLTSDMTNYEYSGWLAGYTYLQNALYSTDRDLWREIYDSLDEYVILDLREDNAYWNSFRSPVTTAAESVYDGYLKSNGVNSGIRSYSECVELLVHYYLDRSEE